MMKMTWLLMWLNVSTATLNSMLQLLVLYRLEQGLPIKAGYLLYFQPFLNSCLPD